MFLGLFLKPELGVIIFRDFGEFFIGAALWHIHIANNPWTDVDAGDAAEDDIWMVGLDAGLFFEFELTVDKRGSGETTK